MYQVRLGLYYVYLFGVVLVQLGLAAVASPEAEDLGLWAVGHVDDALEPPALDDGAAHGAQDEPVVAHLHEAQLARRVRAHLHREAVPVHLARCQRLQVDVVPSLRHPIKNTNTFVFIFIFTMPINDLLFNDSFPLLCQVKYFIYI